MADLVSCSIADGVATVTMDDGKVNALSLAMQAEISQALDSAAEAEAVVVLRGREQTFSAGFDLRCEPERFGEMVQTGAELAAQVLAYPRPVIAACNGNAIAMGAFLLLASDLRIGVAGDFKIGLNEVAIGLTVPYFGIALAEHRLNPAFRDRCLLTGEVMEPQEALRAGFLDRVADPGDFDAAVETATSALLAIDTTAHRRTKERQHERVLTEVRAGAARFDDPDPGNW